MQGDSPSVLYSSGGNDGGGGNSEKRSGRHRMVVIERKRRLAWFVPNSSIFGRDRKGDMYPLMYRLKMPLWCSGLHH